MIAVVELSIDFCMFNVRTEALDASCDDEWTCWDMPQDQAEISISPT
ncbi:hypothetical protein LIMNO130_10102 [Limnobacter sp. 130]|nr:hypothetical protein LIMNO130_10102 [Limnobacter sp. 130]